MGFDLQLMELVEGAEGSTAKTINVPEKVLNGFIEFLNAEAAMRLMHVRTSDSGISSLDLEIHSQRKGSVWSDKLPANLALNFIGNISVEHKVNSVKFGDFYGTHI